MKSLLLDRFLIKRFILLYFAVLVVFISIFFIVDIVEHIDNFIDNGMSFESVVYYYIYTFPFFVHIGIPMAALLAVVFHFGLMNKRFELVALKASGVSLYRITFPFLILGFVFSIAAFIFEDRVVVPANQILSDFKLENMQRHKKNRLKIHRNIDMNIEGGIILHINEFNTDLNTGNGVTVQFVDGAELRQRIDAKSINWRDGEWGIYSIEKRIFKDKLEQYSLIDSLKMHWNISPEDLIKRKISPSNMTFMQLRTFIFQTKRAGLDSTKWEVNLYFKTAMNFTVFILLLFGIPLVSYQTRSGSFAAGIGMSLIVIFVYTTFLKFGETIGYAGQIPPFLSVWIPNFIFLFFGLLLLYKIPK